MSATDNIDARSFEASRERKRAFKRFREEAGLARGYIKELAQNLGVSRAGLGKALSTDKVEERQNNPGYRFSANLARRLEDHFGLEYMSLEGSLTTAQSEYDSNFEEQIAQVLKDRFIRPDRDLHLVRKLGFQESIDGSSFVIDFAITGKEGNPLLLCECKSRQAIRSTPRQEIMVLSTLGYVSGSRYVVLAINNYSGNTFDPEFLFYELRERRIIELSYLPTASDLTAPNQ
jgi:transcriptional regulator with XRE-family HTH domain